MARRRKCIRTCIDQALYELAREYGFNFSDILETALAHILEERYGVRVTTPRIEKFNRVYEKIRRGRAGSR